MEDHLLNAGQHLFKAQASLAEKHDEKKKGETKAEIAEKKQKKDVPDGWLQIQGPDNGWLYLNMATNVAQLEFPEVRVVFFPWMSMRSIPRVSAFSTKRQNHAGNDCSEQWSSAA